jgi:methyl-accepting chemotaxis protein
MEQHIQGRKSMPEKRPSPILWEESRSRHLTQGLSEENKKRLTDSLENTRRAITTLRASIVNIVREADTVNQVADEINLLVLNSAVESVLLREAEAMGPTCAAEIKKVAAGTMNITYEISRSMENVVADLVGTWKFIKQTEDSLRYILSGVQKLSANVLAMSGIAEDESAARR